MVMPKCPVETGANSTMCQRFLDLYTAVGLKNASSNSGRRTYENICKIWTSEPDRFILDPIHQMPGLNT